MIYSQLAMLTYSVDSLTSYIAGAATMCNPSIVMAPSCEHRDPSEEKTEHVSSECVVTVQCPEPSDAREDICKQMAPTEDSVGATSSAWEPVTTTHYFSEPKRPPSAYFAYAMHSKYTGIHEGIGHRWSTMPATDRKPFEYLATEMKSMYDEQVAEWKKHGKHSGPVFSDEYVRERLSGYVEQPPLESGCDDEVVPVEEWSEVEIQNWCRETMQLAGKAFEQELSRIEHSAPTMNKKGSAKKQCLQARSQLINQRWQIAKTHIPESLHEALQQILLEDVM